MRIAGYPAKDGNVIAVERADSGQRLRLLVEREPREQWRRFTFTVPSTLRGVAVRLTATSNSTGFGNWIAVSEPTQGEPAAAQFRTLSRMVQVLGDLLIQCGFLALIGFSCSLAGSKYLARGYHELTFGVAGVAVFAYVALWVYLISLRAGIVFTWALVFGAALFIVREFRQNERTVRSMARCLRFPLAIWLSFSAMCLALTYLYGRLDDPLGTAAHRYFHWAADNELPLVYALKILHHPQSPVWADWNVYERPPLATGFVLLFSPFVEGRVGYQSLGVLLQGSSLLGVWAFLSSYPLSPFVKRVTLAMVAFSLFVVANTVFVWPKLLCATFLFLAAGIWAIKHGQWRWLDFVYLGVFAGLAMLAHGGSFFPLVAMVLVAVTWSIHSRRLKWFVKRSAAAVLVAAALLVPWMIYASAQGRPTDGLIKWHLGGSLPDTAVNAKSSVRVIWDGYGALSISDIVSNKWSNLRAQFFAAPRDFAFIGDDPSQSRKQIVDRVCSSTFYVVLVPCLLAVLAASSGRRVFQGASKCGAVRLSFWLGFSGTVVWCLLMFGPRMAVADSSGSSAAATLFQSSYFPAVALLVCLALLVARATRVGALLMVTTQFLLFAIVGLGDSASLTPSGALLETSPLDLGMLIAVVVSGLSLVAVLAGMDERRDFCRTTPQPEGRWTGARGVGCLVSRPPQSP